MQANGAPNQVPNANGSCSFDYPLVVQFVITASNTRPQNQPCVQQRHPSTQAPAITYCFHEILTRDLVSVNGNSHTWFSCVTTQDPRDSLCPFPVDSVKRCGGACAIASHSPHSRSGSMWESACDRLRMSRDCDIDHIYCRESDYIVSPCTSTSSRRNEDT
jgi:hypothetical protein